MNEVKKLRESTGLGQTAFAKKYKIPLRTLQNWEYEKRTPPEYTIEFLKKIIEYEKEPQK